jgi:hypothetical protein
VIICFGEKRKRFRNGAKKYSASEVLLLEEPPKPVVKKRLRGRKVRLGFGAGDKKEIVSG